uniref:phosphoethanolamine N-methyltransferase n=1 Tax=Parastrongyloides trichosuri TaxID=131310 RepID=A0A0N4ZKR5_PARTI
MNKLVKKFFSAHLNDIALEIASPSKSFTGNLIRKQLSIGSKILNETAINQFPLQNGNNYLEIGFGRGDGIKIFYDKLKQNNIQSKLFGVEASAAALDKAIHRFALEIEDKEIVLEGCTHLGLLPFPNNFFDGIYHVDVFYYWSDNNMPKIERELFRILKPNCKLVCTMDLNRLKEWEKWNILSSKDFDVMRYLELLEPCGFENIKVEYKQVDKNREIQIISANKPQKDISDDDPEMKFKELENDIKNYLLTEAILNKKIA